MLRMQAQSTEIKNLKPNWKFNSFFSEFNFDDAVAKAFEQEKERAAYSQNPLIQEIYSEGWDSWKQMPGADLVDELIQWDEEERKQHRDEPWFPGITQNQYIWKGELTLEQLKKLYFRTHVQAYNQFSPVSSTIWNAYLENKEDIRELGLWWVHDEDTHQQMLDYFCIDVLKIPRQKIISASIKFGDELKKLPKISHDELDSATYFQAFRDGPSILMGCAQLAERTNVWANKNAVPALMKYYHFAPEDLAFFNVHTFIDLYHIRFGQYILGKYADTKETKEMCKKFFMARRRTQYTRTKEFFEKFLREEKELSMTSADNWLQS